MRPPGACLHEGAGLPGPACVLSLCCGISAADARQSRAPYRYAWRSSFNEAKYREQTPKARVIVMIGGIKWSAIGVGSSLVGAPFYVGLTARKSRSSAKVLCG